MCDQFKLNDYISGSISYKAVMLVPWKIVGQHLLFCPTACCVCCMRTKGSVCESMNYTLVSDCWFDEESLLILLTYVDNGNALQITLGAPTLFPWKFYELPGLGFVQMIPITYISRTIDRYYWCLFFTYHVSFDFPVVWIKITIYWSIYFCSDISLEQQLFIPWRYLTDHIFVT